MANDNKSIVAIPTAVTAQITDLLNQANAALQPYVTALTNDERRGLAKMSDKTQAFVQKVVGYATSNPEFVPSFMDAKDLAIDFGNATGLDPVFQLAQQLCNSLNDTQMVAGSEAYMNALKFYNSSKQGDKSGVPGARSIYEDLRMRFPGTPRKRAGAEPTA